MNDIANATAIFLYPVNSQAQSKRHFEAVQKNRFAQYKYGYIVKQDLHLLADARKNQ